MTDTTSAPPTDPGPPPPMPAGLPSGSDRFFSWVRGLGIVRADGWLSGVCGGLAARLRIDPLIVRGIVVVLAVIGFPALLVYAIAWALLPDVNGRIHLRELFQGRFDPAMVGILILTIVSFVPVVPWLWNAALWPVWAVFGVGSPLEPWGIWDLGSPLGGFGVILALAIIGAATFLIVRSARADRRADAYPPRPASADDASASSAAPSSGEGAATAVAAVPVQGDADSGGLAPAESAVGTDLTTDAAPAAALATVSSGASVVATPDSDAPLSTPGVADAAILTPPPAPGEASDEAIAQWRASHEEWRRHDHAWRRSQQDAERAAREQSRREREAMGVAWAAEVEERRRVRRATRPRTSFAFVLTAIGAAIVGGALASLAALGSPESAEYSGAIGAFAAAAITALAMVVAGIARRRSGFLTAVTIVLLVSGLIATLVGGPRAVMLGYASLTSRASDQSVSQLFGSTDIWVEPLSGSRTVVAGTIDVQKLNGNTYITVNPGTQLILEAHLGGGSVSYSRIDQETGEFESDGVVYPSTAADGASVYDWSIRNGATPGTVTQQRVVLNQTAGSVYITIFEPEDDQ